MRPDEESQGPIIRDRRRIDPATGQVRDTAQAGPQRGPAQAGGQPKPGKHSVSRPGTAGASADQGRPKAGPTSAQAAGAPGAAEPEGAPSGRAVSPNTISIGKIQGIFIFCLHILFRPALLSRTMILRRRRTFGPYAPTENLITSVYAPRKRQRSRD